MKDILGYEISKEKQLKIQPFVTQIEETPTEKSTIRMSIGPSHPAMHGTLQVHVELEGEVFKWVDGEIGYLHTGFEKLGEARSYNQFVPLSDRTNYFSPLANNIGFAIAVEELLGIEIPKRAQYIRVILAELTRIADHILNVGFFALDIGAFSAFLWAFEERERLYDIFEKVTGTRLTTSYTRIGGVAMDFPKGIEKEILQFERHLNKAMHDLSEVLLRNRIFLDRSQGIGVITPEEALDFGLTGPVLRGSGIPYDLRKDKPYSSYEDFDFQVVTQPEGDCYARFMVRFREIFESYKIVKQALANLPDGPVNALSQKVSIPHHNDTYTDMESMIHHFKLIMPGMDHGIRCPLEHHYSVTESPNGELGYFIVSNGTSSPYRIRIRPPSLFSYQTVNTVLPGHLLPDLPVLLGSLNIIAGELDR